MLYDHLLARLLIRTILMCPQCRSRVRTHPYQYQACSHCAPAIINRLSALYPSIKSYTPEDGSEHRLDSYTYHPVFQTLYAQFLAMLHSICSPFTADVEELAYIASATWPAFIRPVVDQHRRWHEAQREEGAEDVPDSEGEKDGVHLALPTEETRIRLIRLFTPSITAALEALYPRHTNAVTWARANIPPPNLLSIPPSQVPPLVTKNTEDREGEKVMRQLPRMAKFVLVASYLASTNPARTDMRMFARGPDERAKRRKKGGGTRKMSAKASAVKVCGGARMPGIS
jgi:origin recognition complex subunit 5